MAKARSEKPHTARVLVRAEWVEELPADDVPEPGAQLHVEGRELTVWSVGAPGRAERPACDVRVRATEDGLLAGWQLAALEGFKRGWGPAAPRNDTAPPEPPASWGARVRLVAHVPGGRLEPVTRHERDLTVDKALDVLVDATEEAVRGWQGGTFGVTGRVVLTADGREQLRAEIARAKGGPADVVGVIDAMEAITLAAERLYAEANPGAPAGTPGTGASEPDNAREDEDVHDDDDLWDAMPEDEGRGEARFRYWLHGDGVDEPLETEHPLSEGDELETGLGPAVVGHIGPPAPDGYRPVSVRVTNPGHD